jgi:hypothetical protein
VGVVNWAAVEGLTKLARDRNLVEGGTISDSLNGLATVSVAGSLESWNSGIHNDGDVDHRCDVGLVR